MKPTDNHPHGELNGTVRGAPSRPKGQRVNETPDGALDFERSDEREGRVGDAKTARDLRDQFPPARVREAGQTGGEMPDSSVTADDMSPETLLDSEASHTPDSNRGRVPEDSRLTTQTGLAGGRGLDEAEMAEKEPVGKRSARATQRKAKAHARDINAFEPHERAVQAEIAKDAQGRKPH